MEEIVEDEEGDEGDDEENVEEDVNIHELEYTIGSRGCKNCHSKMCCMP